MEEVNKGGRPLLFKTPDDLQEKIDAYFASCMDEVWEQDQDGKWHPVFDRFGNVATYQKEPFTISGLAVFLGTDRKTLLNYEDREEFFHTIKSAKARIEHFTEKQLYNSSAKNMTGIIFNLKNNYGWQDKQEVEQTGSMNHQVQLGEMNDDEIRARIADEIAAVSQLQARIGS